MNAIATIRSSRRHLAALTATVLLAVMFLTSGVLSALANDPAPRVAFLARSDNPVDALAASAVAAQAGGVVLLTRSDQLEQPAADGLATYQPDLVILAGGTAALSPQIEEDVTALGYAWERVSGPSRTETARMLADRLQTLDRAYLGVDGTASNSTRLQGRTAPEMVRAASFQTTQAQAQLPGLPGVNSVVGSVEIVAPTKGWLVIDAGTHWTRQAAGNHTVQCFLRVDGEFVDHSLRGARSEQMGSCDTQARISVDSGTRTVQLVGQSSPYAQAQPTERVDFGARSVVVQFVPFDGNGNPIVEKIALP